MTSVLVSYGLQLICESKEDLTQADKEQIIRILSDFTEKKVNLEISKSRLLKFVDVNNVLERLNQIVDIDDFPLPDPGGSDLNDTGKRKKTRTWTDNEDNRLIMAVYKFGQENWNAVAQFVGSGRNRAQCSQRWQRVIDPKISKLPFSEEEDQKLIKLLEKYGPKLWTKVAQEMGNRSDVQCRYRYKQLTSSTDLSEHISNQEQMKNMRQNISQPVAIPKPVHLSSAQGMMGAMPYNAPINRQIPQAQFPSFIEPPLAPPPVPVHGEDHILLAQSRNDSSAIFKSDMDLFKSDYFQ